jgi:hypothetical protein
LVLSPSASSPPDLTHTHTTITITITEILRMETLPLSTESAKPRTASTEVLGTAELVILILESLDELSLVRAQGVNSLFHGLIQNTTSLHQRVGLWRPQNSKTDSLKTATKKMHRWNPLLDWLVTRSFLLEDGEIGPISRSAKFVIFHVLPHAHRAAKIPASSIHKILLTDPPVKRAAVILYAHEPCIGKLLRGSRPPYGILVSNEDGVTIGDVLKIWADERNHQKHLPVGIYVQASVEDTTPIPVPDLFVRKFKSSIMSITLFMAEPPPHPNSDYERPDRVCGKLAYEFYKVCTAKGWFDCSMEEQVKAMTTLMQIRKQFGTIKLASSDVKWPAWPALAWKAKAGRYISTVTWTDTKTGKKEKKDLGYRVEYAAGLIFNKGG